MATVHATNTKLRHEASNPPVHPRDPWVWCLVIPAFFVTLASIRLSLPDSLYFDENHYVPAAREFLSWWEGRGGAYRNPEHPPLGKHLIALGIAIAGDDPLGWRIMSLIAGAVAVGAAMRGLWHAGRDRFACVAFGLLLATGFHIFVHARIAMLDIFMAAFLALATWQFAAAIREPETGRCRLAFTGIAIGCALASKWNALPLAALPGLAFFAARLSAGRRRLLASRRGMPVPGISLVEAFAWLGALPVVIYALTFVPGYLMESAALAPSPATRGLIGLHRDMITLQQSVIAPHDYQSTLLEWMLNIRGIWYAYDFTDGAWRGVLLIGNPLTMLLGLPALFWCLWSGFAHGDWARLGAVTGYAASLGLWAIAPKPVQFYYHYVMPSVFLLAALAMTLSDIRVSEWRWWAYGALAGSIGVFALFFPILSAAALDGPRSFTDWAWIAGWR